MSDHMIPDAVAQTVTSLQLGARLFLPVPADLGRRLARENGGVVPSYAELVSRLEQAESTGGQQ